MRPANLWQLAIGALAVTGLLMLTASGNGLQYAQRRMLLSSRPLDAAELSGETVVSGVGGQPVHLPPVNTTGYKRGPERCKAPPQGSPPLPALRREANWMGANASLDGNVTIVTTLHVDRLPLLEEHCALWPHKIVAAVYVPLSSSGQVTCVEEVTRKGQEPQKSSWLSWLGLSTGPCAHAGWRVERLRRHVRSVQKRAQEQGQCNLHVQLWSETMAEPLRPAMGLLPQGALQNRALRALEADDPDGHHTVVLLDSDLVTVNVWQLANTTRQRAEGTMQQGAVMVLPAFQLAPGFSSDDAWWIATQIAAMPENATHPLRSLYQDSMARSYQDHGFPRSQLASLPELWFEAGQTAFDDIHVPEDDGYPVAPHSGFAPVIMMLQRHVIWADERLRGSYYQRAWQALALRGMGLQLVVQPNMFALQLPHEQAYSRGEAELSNVLEMEPVFRDLVGELALGKYVPVTSFYEECTLKGPVPVKH